ncbi:MAG: Plug domain-containing protein, partial [Gemmatimonadaceae bacterium]|nr:Plug domain-containing protein [Gemmatimonadaceae bacterium]
MVPRPIPPTTRSPSDTMRAPTRAPTRAVPPADSAAVGVSDTAAAPMRGRPPKDSIKAPIAVAELPVASSAGRWHWNRDSLYAVGAFNVAELLERIPGVTLLRSGFIASPQVVLWNGGAERVRLFWDGIELDAIDPRGGRALDLGRIQLLSLESVTAERSPGELRVHLRTWTVRNTTPVTRVDVASGSENFTLYRGFFGRRFDNGGLLQLAGQQYSTLSRPGGDGDLLNATTRIGWARRDWSVDFFAISGTHTRNATTADWETTTPIQNALPAWRGNVGLSYARIGWRSPEGERPWVQFVASRQHVDKVYKAPSSSGFGTTTSTASRDTTDSLSARTQYVLSGGASWFGVRGSATLRVREIEGERRFAPTVRLSRERTRYGVSGYAETSGSDSTDRAEVAGWIAPWPRLVVRGALARRSATGQRALAWRIQAAAR